MRVLALAAALVPSLLPALALAGAPVALKQTPMSRGDSVTLADLFDGAAGPAARTVVAPAASPGLDAVLDAGKVQFAAKAAGFDWDNPQGMRRIVVVSAGASAPVAASRPGRSAQVLAYARNIAAGEILQAADLMWSDAAFAPPDAPGDPDRLIGQAARRPLRAGAAATRSDLVAPAVVHRDEIVSVVFEVPGISLVLQAKALKDAGAGETVQVLNLQSKKVIEAVASSPGKAVVGPRAESLKAAPFATASLR